jgi:hypothetical protein
MQRSVGVSGVTPFVHEADRLSIQFRCPAYLLPSLHNTTAAKGHGLAINHLPKIDFTTPPYSLASNLHFQSRIIHHGKHLPRSLLYVYLYLHVPLRGVRLTFCGTWKRETFGLLTTLPWEERACLLSVSLLDSTFSSITSAYLQKHQTPL